ncbi:hypothetical protein SARC_13419, partial [Sphaeroforma arctica JP610]
MTRHIEAEFLKGRWEVKCPVDQNIWTLDDITRCVQGQLPIQLKIQRLLAKRVSMPINFNLNRH